MTRPGIALIVTSPSDLVRLTALLHELGEDGYIIDTTEILAMAAGGIDRAESRGVPGRTAGSSRGERYGHILLELTRQYQRQRPGAVVVLDDSLGATAGAQAAHYEGIPVVHIGAGRRSQDRVRPEDIDGKVIASMANVHCAATVEHWENLMDEGISPAAITITGSPAVETVQSALRIANAADSIPHDLGKLIPQCVLFEISRPEHLKSQDSLQWAFSEVSALDAPVLLLASPQLRAAMERFGLDHYEGSFTLMDSTDYPRRMALARRARLVVSDSDVLHEECAILRTPMLLLRSEAARDELAIPELTRIIAPFEDFRSAGNLMLNGPREEWQGKGPSRGDGLASRRIALISQRVAGRKHAEDAIIEAEYTLPYEDPTVPRFTTPAIAGSWLRTTAS